MKLNWLSTSNNECNLVFPAVTDTPSGKSYPSVTIPLFASEYSVPVRTPKIQEINVQSPANIGFDDHYSGTFYGAPEPLKAQFGGFVRTPVINNVWSPTVDGTRNGVSLGLTYVNNVELVLAYIEGRMSRGSTGLGVRVDPTSFTDPYGNVYSNPVILSFEGAITAVMKKQTFTIQLWLEDGTYS